MAGKARRGEARHGVAGYGAAGVARLGKVRRVVVWHGTAQNVRREAEEKVDEMIFTSTHPDIGDPMQFRPSAFAAYEGNTARRNMLNGRVVYINETHRYYTAEAVCNGYVIRESWKF